jgi:hypothetical protein
MEIQKAEELAEQVFSIVGLYYSGGTDYSPAITLIRARDKAKGKA